MLGVVNGEDAGGAVLDRRSFRQVSTNPIFPILILGVLAAAFFFASVLNAPTNVVFGVLFIGCLTTAIETRGRDDLDRQ